MVFSPVEVVTPLRALSHCLSLHIRRHDIKPSHQKRTGAIGTSQHHTDRPQPACVPSRSAVSLPWRPSGNTVGKVGHFRTPKSRVRCCADWREATPNPSTQTGAGFASQSPWKVVFEKHCPTEPAAGPDCVVHVSKGSRPVRTEGDGA